jgi:hypothetical protein
VRAKQLQTLMPATPDVSCGRTVIEPQVGNVKKLFTADAARL